MTSTKIRQSFLDFFKSKSHTIVPSSSLMPDSPNLLFTNAGMNQFVPIFLGQTACPYSPPRAADTQKCIRAGGKHNDLDDVGLDTYHHTFFEMLGNWSFGDYFKKEAIEWAWELIVEVWKFPSQRLYATVYSPDKTKNDPSEFDQEAWDIWAKKFRAVGLDPAVHIVNGNKKDNFWMMGETGPCGPCSELHVDLTPNGDTRGTLVNKGDARCIEIWNLVFIQFNANPDGTFAPLPARHVDTGMGFERVTSIIQGTKSFTDFANAKISNYETDIFRPIFDKLEKLSGKKYTSTLPGLAKPENESAPLKTVGEAPGGMIDVRGATAPSSSTLPTQNVPPLAKRSAQEEQQEAVDVAFRVIADHIRTLSFAIADGIQPGNTDRNYVLRRILRRAVRYGRTLGFREPFFYKLVDVLADTMGDVFPEIRARRNQVEETIQREEEAFNKTLDRGIELFNEEVARLGKRLDPGPGGTGYQPVAAGDSPGVFGIALSKRNLPHFEKPWAIYAVNFQTQRDRKLSPAARDIVFDCILKWRDSRYRLVAACVMPDHVHLIVQPGIKSIDDGSPVFWPLSEIMHSVKSFSAKEINKLEGAEGSLWQDERFDRYVRSDRDLEEKFRYVCGNPWAAGVAEAQSSYRWLWTDDIEAASPYLPPTTLPYRSVGQVAQQDGPVARSTQNLSQSNPGGVQSSARGGRAPHLSGEFAFKLYDTYGFPLDLTELMARERGLTVDVAGFEKLMEEQRARARAAQKKEIISVSEIESTKPTRFVGFESLSVPAKVLEVVKVKDKSAIILDTSSAYAEMGGQVGDTGEIILKSVAANENQLTSPSGAEPLSLRVANTQKTGETWLHFVEGTTLPAAGEEVVIRVDRERRHAIQRHHTVTHLLHWALHEVVSKEASQKGSLVAPEKLTFDFNSAPLSAEQLRDIEHLVNERILENEPVSWTEVPYADVKARKEVMQFFGDKYGETVRVVQIGGGAGKLDGYSMELCGGTHVRATGEIGLFRIVSESAIAAGVRRIEAVAGLEAYNRANQEQRLIKTLAARMNAPVGELEKKVDGILAQQKELEKQIKSAQQREATHAVTDLLNQIQTINGIPAIIQNLGATTTEQLQLIADEIKSKSLAVAVLGSTHGGSVGVVVTVPPQWVQKVNAGNIVKAIAPIVGGKGGGKPDNARGGGKDPAKLDEALAKARDLIA